MTDAADIIAMPITQESMQRFRRDAMLGIDVVSTTSLQTLALTAIESRFSTPMCAAIPVVNRLHINDGAYLAPAARRALLRLLLSKDGTVTDHFASAIPHVLHRAQRLLHPFDFAKLEHFIAHQLAHLGQNEVRWLDRVRPAKVRVDDSYWDGPLTDEYLPRASKSQKINYLSQLRSTEPARARELITNLMTNEIADTRAGMVRLLQVGLSNDDREFLQSLNQDRAPTVKQLADTLLARLPGSDSESRTIALVRDYLAIKSDGILKRTKVLVYQGPAIASGEPEPKRWALLLDGLSLHVLETALNESTASLIEIAANSPKQPQLFGHIARMLLHEGKLELFADAYAAIDNQIEAFFSAVFDQDFATLSPDQRQHAVRVCIGAKLLRPKLLSNKPNVQLIYRFLQSVATGEFEPLPDDIGGALLDALIAQIAEDSNVQYPLGLLASVLSDNLSKRVIASCEDSAPRAALFHHFLLAAST
jgi:hypothetical protein